MLAIVLSRASFGTDAPEVAVEVHISTGLPTLTIVGLPEGAVRESKERVRSAITTAGFEFPSGRILINLAPADLPKDGARFDLPIALGLLAASGQIPADALKHCEFFGELSLGATLKPVRGILPAVAQAARSRRRLIISVDNLAEARLVAGVEIAGATHLFEVCQHLHGRNPLEFVSSTGNEISASLTATYPDLSDVRDQPHARRALEIAAAGSHSLLLIGPPGTGKSMLAHRLPGLLPPLTASEAMDVAAIASVSSRGFRVEEWGRRPFRAPHHTASALALTGGGARPQPGEISLAHHGVLFLDELTEFDRHALEVLREPLETGAICISRSGHQAEFPARFQLIAAINPCPCGYLGVEDRPCRCSEALLGRYRARISGPLLDRLDLHVRVARVRAASLGRAAAPEETSAQVAARVSRARAAQHRRQQTCNAHLPTHEIERHCMPDEEGGALLERAVRRFELSARAYHRILRVARSIADLEGAPSITGEHIIEAVLFRQLDGEGMMGYPATERSYRSAVRMPDG